MTRFVGEPSQERKARQGVWGVEDLRKRPAPEVDPAAGGDIAYIYRETFTAQTINNGAWTQVQLSTGTTDNQDTPRFGVQVADPDITDVKLAGLYGIKGQVYWSSAFAALTGMRFASSSAFGWFFGQNWTEPGGAGGDGATAPFIYCVRRFVGGTSGVEFHVRQDSGVAQDIDSASFEIHFFGTYTGTADQF